MKEMVHVKLKGTHKHRMAKWQNQRQVYEKLPQNVKLRQFQLTQFFVRVFVSRLDEGKGDGFVVFTRLGIGWWLGGGEKIVPAVILEVTLMYN